MKAVLLIIFVNLTMGTGNVTVKEMHENVLRMPDLSVICHNLNTSYVSDMCLEQMKIICKNVTLFMTMLAASSRFPFTGLGFSSKTDLGNFDQCMTIDHTQNGIRILGEHCTEGLLVPDFLGDAMDPNLYAILSVCRPNGCDSDDYNELVLSNISENFPEAFLDDVCQTVESRKKFGIEDAITLSIFAVVICVLIISTMHDIHIKRNKMSSSHPLLLAFSMLSNGSKLFHISKRSTSKEQLEVLQGLRVISMMWIVAGHGFMAWHHVPIANEGKSGKRWTNFVYAGYINTAPLAVDTFYFIAGFLVAFQYMKYKKRSLASQLLSVPAMYIHRYLRLTPALLMIYLVIISIFKHLGSGPLWPHVDENINNCKEHWWAVFLYAQNYNNYDQLCLPQTWFLSAVMQMFIISPVVLIPLNFVLRRPCGLKCAMIILLILNIFFIIIPMAHKIYAYNYKNEYDMHSRLTDYFIGMALGIFMRENISKPFLHAVKEHRKAPLNVLIWVLIILDMSITLVCFQLAHIIDKNGNKFVFHSLMRPLWCIGLSWVIYSCYHGYGGFINWILCRPSYQILGRLTYSIYLVHQSVIDYHTYTTRTAWYFTDFLAFYLFCGHYVVSVIIATFWTLAFESPLVVIEKYLLRKEDKPVLDKSTPSQPVGCDEMARKYPLQNGNNEDVECGELYKKNNEPF